MKKLAVAVAISTCLVGLIIAGFPRLGDAATIYGCYGKFAGLMRIVSGPGQCSRLENPISWNDVGPEGPAGPSGINVAAGQQCPQGNAVVGFDQNGNIICSYVIGDVGPAGGIVFYVDASKLHGLEAAPADQDPGEWGCNGTEIAGADGRAVGTGAQNTADILAGCLTAGIAARIADDYTLNGYHHWFLPSKDELNLLYQQKDVVGGFAVDYYWSSTEGGSGYARAQGFDVGNQEYGDKNYPLRVRAVRAF